MTKNDKYRPFLKWAGGKYNLVEKIESLLAERKCLVEPFVGAGSIFLNTNFEYYVLADINADLINLFKIVKSNPKKFIKETEKLFIADNNQPERFYKLREQFNLSDDIYERARLFLYLNKHGYNGLCRYNSAGQFNVPFGRYKKAPLFPQKEILNFSEKAQRADFYLQSFKDTFANLSSDSVVYCDPPYAPLSPTESFTQYHIKSFGDNEQIELAELAQKTARDKNIPVLISNHSTPFTQKIYADAEIYTLDVQRTISRSSVRKKVPELLALFT